MPRPLTVPPPSGVFYPPGLFGRLALQTPGRPFADVAQSMQMPPHRLGIDQDPDLGGEIVREQDRGPVRAVHAVLMGIVLTALSLRTIATYDR